MTSSCFDEVKQIYLKAILIQVRVFVLFCFLFKPNCKLNTAVMVNNVDLVKDFRGDSFRLTPHSKTFSKSSSLAFLLHPHAVPCGHSAPACSFSPLPSFPPSPPLALPIIILEAYNNHFLNCSKNICLTWNLPL